MRSFLLVVFCMAALMCAPRVAAQQCNAAGVSYDVSTSDGSLKLRWLTYPQTNGECARGDFHVGFQILSDTDVGCPVLTTVVVREIETQFSNVGWWETKYLAADRNEAAGLEVPDCGYCTVGTDENAAYYYGQAPTRFGLCWSRSPWASQIALTATSKDGHFDLRVLQTFYGNDVLGVRHTVIVLPGPGGDYVTFNRDGVVMDNSLQVALTLNLDVDEKGYPANINGRGQSVTRADVIIDGITHSQAASFWIINGNSVWTTGNAVNLFWSETFRISRLKDCTVPWPPEGTSAGTCAGSLKTGRSCTYTLLTGYTLSQGSLTVGCTGDGELTNTPPVLTANPCPPPNPLPEGTTVGSCGSATPSGGSCKLTAMDGWILRTGSLTLNCLAGSFVQLPFLSGQDCVTTQQIGSCSVSCGSGTKTLTRIITTPPTGNGAPCPPLSETFTCNTGIQCPSSSSTGVSTGSSISSSTGVTPSSTGSQSSSNAGVSSTGSQSSSSNGVSSTGASLSSTGGSSSSSTGLSSAGGSASSTGSQSSSSSGVSSTGSRSSSGSTSSTAINLSSTGGSRSSTGVSSTSRASSSSSGARSSSGGGGSAGSTQQSEISSSSTGIGALSSSSSSAAPIDTQQSSTGVLNSSTSSSDSASLSKNTIIAIAVSLGGVVVGLSLYAISGTLCKAKTAAELEERVSMITHIH